MLHVERFVNELMSSNSYVIYDKDKKRCIVIDPGSEKSLREIEFIENKGFFLDYIIITHEHTDHNWGVNALREYFSKSRLICSEECSNHIKKANRAYFLLYYDDPDYQYEITPADVLVKECGCLDWNGQEIRFVMTPGHSRGSMCINIEGLLFTGDTIMPFKPYFNGRDSNLDDWTESIKLLLKDFDRNILIYPGHGERLTLNDWIKNYCKI